MVIRTALASLLLLTVACGGSDKTSETPKSQPAEAGLNAGPVPKEGGTETATPPAENGANAAPVELSAEDKKALDRMEQLAKEMLGAVEKAGSDCDKMAANLNKFVDANGAELKKLSHSFEKAPEGKKQKLDAEMQTRMKGKSEAAVPSLIACKEHAGVTKVFERLDAL